MNQKLSDVELLTPLDSVCKYIVDFWLQSQGSLLFHNINLADEAADYTLD